MLMFNLFLLSPFAGIKGNLNALVVTMMNLCYRCVRKSCLATEVSCGWSCMNAYAARS